MLSTRIRRGLIYAAVLALGSMYMLPLVGHQAGDHPGESDHAMEDELARLAAEEAVNNGFTAPSVVAAATPPAPQDYAVVGVWDPTLITWPHVAVSAANLPDGRILTWSSSEINAFPSGNPEFTYATVWDPVSGAFTDVSHQGHDMFCGHQVMLEDGRVFVTGGRNHVATTSVFDVATNQWLTLPDTLNNGRWYPSAIALADGTVLTAVGSSGGEFPELWEPGSGWRRLTGIDLTNPILQYNDGRYYEANWWPYFVQSSQGGIIHYGPTPRMHRLTTFGSGTIQDVGGLTTRWFPKHGASVLFADGKVLLAGGAVSGTNLASTNLAMTIDVSGANPVVDESIAPMIHARKFQNAVVLPSGEVLMVGGNTNGQKFNDDTPVYHAELWNPQSQTWREMAPQQEERTYHSVALLMMDGRVWSAGGGLCGACQVNHLNAEIYSPPYLFNGDGSLATRPQIFSSPALANHADTITVTATPGIDRFSLIKMSSTTHAVNTDQRQITPAFNEIPAGATSDYDIDIHTNSNVLTRGYYMLFALNAAGTPSVASTLQIYVGDTSMNYPPSLEVEAIGNLRVNVSVVVDVNAIDIDDTTITYSATGLPVGLQIDSASGKITGVPTQIGLYSVTITATDSRGASDNETFEWLVSDATGLRYDYYRGTWNALPNFDSLTPAYSGFVSEFDIGVADASDDFGVRFQGSIRIDQSGLYTFFTTSDDGSRLLIDGVLVVDNDGLHGSRERQGSLSLAAGFYAIDVEFFERGGSQSLSVDYAGPGFAKTALPATVLYLEEPGANSDPIIVNPGPLSSNLNQNVDVTISASDPDPDILQFFASNLPTGLSIDASSGDITGVTAAEGIFTVDLLVIDGVGGADNEVFTWTVEAAGPLTIDPMSSPPQLVNTVIDFTAVVSGGVNPQLTWDFGDGSTPFGPIASVDATHSYAQPGRYLVAVTATGAGNEVVTRFFIQNVHLPLTSERPRVSTSIVYEGRAGDHDRVWNVNPDNDTVSVIDVDTNVKIAEVPVGRNPRSLALAADGDIWVANRLDDSISVIDRATLGVSRTIALPRGSQPHGLVRDRATDSFWIVFAGTGEIAMVGVNGALLSRATIGGRLRHLSINAAGDTLYAPRFVTPRLPGESTIAPQVDDGAGGFYGAQVARIDTQSLSETTTVLRHSDRPDAENAGRGIPNYLGPVVISPDGQRGWVPSKQDNILRGQFRDGLGLDHDNTIRSISSVIDLAGDVEEYAARMDHDDAGIAVSGAFGPVGVYLYVVLEGSREVAMIDAHKREEVLRIPVGRAPQGIVVSPDGNSVFVHNFMDRSVIRLDVEPVVFHNAASASVAASYQVVTNEALAGNVLNGKQLFYDAFDSRLASQRYVSCAACHNDGGHDGRIWDFGNFGEGLRNTIDLRGRAGMQHGPLHWSGNFDEVQDFENQIRNFAHGTGLMSDAAFNAGSRADPLGDAKAGISQDLDDLAAYVASLDEYPISPWRQQDGAMSADAISGQAVFAAKDCAACHAGSDTTDSALDVRHDIGTLATGSGNRLGGALGGLDTPTLRGVWASAPYLHNGAAARLEDAITAHNNVNLTASELTLVTTYLAQLEASNNDPTANCGPPSFDPAVDRALFVWQDCDGLVHVVGAGSASAASYTGDVIADQNFTAVTSRSLESGDFVDASAGDRIVFDLTMGGAWVDEFEFTLASGSTACLSVSAQSAGSAVLAGPNRTPMTGPFDPVTLQSCTPPGESNCGAPAVDRAADPGVFIWKNCGGPWSLMATGLSGSGTINVSGLIASSLGINAVIPKSVESSDTIDSSNPNLITFALRTTNPWGDRFDLDVAGGDTLCIGVDPLPQGMGVYVGLDKAPVSGQFNPETLQSCALPEDPGCGTPVIDPAVDSGLFVWKACNGPWSLMITGTAPGVGISYAGSIQSTLGFSAITPISTEASDSLTTELTAPISFDLSTANPWNDRFEFSAADGAGLCVAVSALPPGGGIFAGPQATPVTAPFDPLTLSGCN